MLVPLLDDPWIVEVLTADDLMSASALRSVRRRTGRARTTAAPPTGSGSSPVSPRENCRVWHNSWTRGAR
ncbi:MULTISPECIES: hypothetical protein [unclassified Streptomyces]|uniref:hypothetical protein n=1 Tax=unclassified Streptomyces TaxID=2593676 RepID=UPI00333153BA